MRAHLLLLIDINNVERKNFYVAADKIGLGDSTK